MCCFRLRVVRVLDLNRRRSFMAPYSTNATAWRGYAKWHSKISIRDVKAVANEKVGTPPNYSAYSLPRQQPPAARAVDAGAVAICPFVQLRTPREDANHIDTGAVRRMNSASPVLDFPTDDDDKASVAPSCTSVVFTSQSRVTPDSLPPLCRGGAKGPWPMKYCLRPR